MVRRRANAGLVLVSLASGAILLGCRNGARPSDQDAEASAPVSEGSSAPSAQSVEDASAPDSEAGAEMHEDRHRDAGAIFACRGERLSLLGAALEPRCGVTEREWNARARLAPDGGHAVSDAPSVRQSARREGDRVVISLVNEGPKAVMIPLRFHPAHPELAFSVLATPSTGETAVFELVPPAHDAPEPTSSPPLREKGAKVAGPRIGLDDAGSPMHVYHAMIELPPRGVAEARLAIDPRIVRRLDRDCPAPVERSDGAAPGCPERLRKGGVTLYIGQLVAPTVDSPPARVDWTVP